MSVYSYTKISGVWNRITAVYKKISGTWYPLKYIYKKVSGVWQPVHRAIVEYTFASSITSTSTTGILLSSYVDPASADEFIITINTGVVLKGKTGTTGIAGSVTVRANCHSSVSGNGGNGGTGYPALNFTGFSGKKITIVNNGKIIGGTGGVGGNLFAACGSIRYSGCGGAGGNWYYNIAGVTFVYSPAGDIGPGAAGAHGSPTSYSVVCNCNCTCDCECSCFIKGQPVLMADGSFKLIEDIIEGDQVRGAYGDTNTVMYLDRPFRKDRTIYRYNNLLATADHPILKADRKGFYVLSVKAWLANFQSGAFGYKSDGSVTEVPVGQLDDVETLRVGDEVASRCGTIALNAIEETDIDDEQLYHLIVDGSKTYNINGIFVSSFSDSTVDYKKLAQNYRKTE